MKVSRVLLVALGLACAGVGTASALGFFSMMNDLGITNEDYGIIKKAAATLYDVDTPKVGSETVWNNPATGAYGAIRVTEFDGKCVQLLHVFRTKKTRDVHQVESRRCKAADGTWKLDFE